VRRVLALSLLLLACTTPGADPKPREGGVEESREERDVEVSLAGVWRATLLSPGGELPFTLNISESGGILSAVAMNDEEEIPFSTVERQGTTLRMRIDGYDSEITATLSEDGRLLQGEWRKTVPAGSSKMPFSAVKGDTRRFVPELDSSLEPVEGAPESITGRWALTFSEEDGSSFPARAELESKGSQLTGTILTETGDYRYLEGSYANGWLLLSVFDGGHAFLFRARVSPEQTMKGDFWSRDSYHATFTGRRLQEGESDGRGDPWKLIELTDEDGRFAFEFPDLAGKLVSSRDERFSSKVVLVDIFGTWCPNCNDQAPLLVTWHRKYRAQGLEIVGLAYEMTGNIGRDREYVGKYRDKYGIEFQLLLAGVSNKAEASKTVPDLSEVAAYPTTIFIGRDGNVRRIYSGFSGPATGAHHHEMVAEHEELIEKLLAERL
jgi:thiol-disulfide isomerase/thioredoxin